MAIFDVEFPIQRLRAAMLRAGEDERAAVLRDMDQAASRLVSVLQSSYPQGATGNLRRGVRKKAATTFGYIVRSTAPHVHFIEQGTRDRFDATRANAARGRVVGRSYFIPAAIRERRTFLRTAQSRLNRHREL